MLALLLLMHWFAATAQSATIRVAVHADDKPDTPIAAASVVVNDETYATDERGTAVIIVPPGTISIVVSKEGFAPTALTLTVAAGETRPLAIALEQRAAVEEHVTVSATRTGAPLEDQPMRVEVLEHDEVEEKLMMTPGDIVMMLNEMGGLRVQATSPSLGAASVRIQGMRGRYTRFLSDGLPLFGEQTGGFGLLQIPPMDLGQVEVIKGVASSLYGAGAIGGVVNLVSRRPGTIAQTEALVNRSSRGATDGVFWYAAPLSERWGASLLGGAHGQTRDDVNEDGWADLSGYTRGVIRPRVYFDDHAGRSFFATSGVTIENRRGGTVGGAVLPGSGQPYEESLDTRRADVGVVAQTIVGAQYLVSARGSFTHQQQDHRFGEVLERDRHRTGFGELTVRRQFGSHTWIAGAAIEHDAYDPRDVPRFGYQFTTPGLFVQDDVTVAKWLSISASARADRHSEFGTFVSPRVSALFRVGPWSSRASAGSGFFPATALTEETEAAGLSRLHLDRPLKAERGRSVSIDLTYASGSASATATIFRSIVHDPVEVEREADYAIHTLDGPTTNRGLELIGTWRPPHVSVVASYAYVHALERDAGIVREVPLTPRHSAGIDTAWEKPGVLRIGFEWYYTGRQRLDANPYRTESRGYMVFGALVERRFGRVRVFVNGENLGDVRQTDWDPLIRPSRGVDGRWAVDAWAPLDGRNINAGLRLQF